MENKDNQPLVSVGIPTYNRPEGLRRTLECITSQTYQNLEIIVSDNCSPGPETERVVREFMERNPRIQYYRPEKNQGLWFNFKFVLEKATGEFFMWAADDDEWDEHFIHSCVKNLQDNERIGVAFCNIVNTDSFGRIIRSYPLNEFQSFSGINSFRTIYAYLLSPEILGKANIIYGLYRKELITDLGKMSILSDDWGVDMCFVLAALARSGIAIDQRVLFYKRITRITDTQDHIDHIIIKNPKNHIFPFNRCISYLKSNLKATKGTRYYWLTLLVLIIRIPRSFYIFLKNSLIGIFFRSILIFRRK